jgi:hypothetical protein
VTRATKPAKPPSKAPSKAPAKAPSKPAAKPEPAAPPLAAQLAAQLSAQPAAVVLALLQKESVALTAGAIKAKLMASGVDRATAESVWSRARDKIRFDDHVIVDKNSYRFTATARTISPEEAVYRLSRGGDPAKRSALLAVIQAALEGGAQDPAELAEARDKIAAAEQRIGTLELQIAKLSAEMAAERAAEKAALNAAKAAAEQALATVAKAGEQAAAPAPTSTPADETAHAQYERSERRRAARERQARIDAMAAVAELAAEVEELTAKRAPSDVLLEHTRALTGGSGLEAIGRAGEATSYNESHHDPVGDFPNDGDPVIVIRPGYLWHAPGEAVLISKALVTRA